MDQYHRSHKKKVGTGTGGRMGKPRDKKLSHMGRPFANTKIRENEDRVTIRLRGGKTKQKLKKALMAFAINAENCFIRNQSTPQIGGF